MQGSRPRIRCAMVVSLVLLAGRESTGGVMTAGFSLRAPTDSEGRHLQDTTTVSNTSDFPTPVAHFSLSGNFVGTSNVSTTVYNGMGVNHTWDIDEEAGTVLQCSKARGSRVQLPAVQYGRQGPWAINLWFKPSNESGNQFQYLFSHNSTKFSNYSANPYSPNQIRLYFPEILHPAYGVLRALVKDSYNTANVSSHMDSDGQVGDTTSTVDSPPFNRHFLADGLWHMATLTTHTNMSSGLQGYVMLLDGQLRAFQAANRLYISSNRSSVFAGTDGGRPMILDGKIVLCGHSDAFFSRSGDAASGKGSRYYNGGISQLSIFDTSLSPAHVLALYNQGPNGSWASSTSGPLGTPPQSTVKERGIVQPYPQLPDKASLTPQQAALESLPSPAAFFPLSDGSLQSSPLLTPDQYRAYPGGSVNATFVQDPDTFGRTLYCNKGAGSRVWLLPPPYWRGGRDRRATFTINLWFKVGDSGGEVFQYLLSQLGRPNGNEWGPSQVSIYFPEQQHPRFGILRAVIKDTTDEFNSSSRGQMVYLDSDGKVANNIATPALNRPNPLTDGRWHMVTMTTLPDLSTGFLLFLDGVAVGVMRHGTYTGSNGTVNATGGGSMNLTTPLVLCERADGDPFRGFDGRLSSLGIWTTVLSPANISALYDYGLSEVPYMGNTAVPDDNIVVTLTPDDSSMLPSAGASPAMATPLPVASSSPMLPASSPMLPASSSPMSTPAAALLPGTPQSSVRDNAAAGAEQSSKDRGLAVSAIAGIVVGAVVACVLASALAFMLYKGRKRGPIGSGKFETFRDEAGSFPVSSTAAEPNAQILRTQDSSKFLMPH